MVDGRVVTGLLVNRNEREIQLRDQQGTLQTLERDEVQSFNRLAVSLMPEGLHQLMTTRELIDLVAYLSSLTRAEGAGEEGQ